MPDASPSPLRGSSPQPQPRFRDRTQAGVALASALSAHRGKPDTVVLGLSNGGMVTAAALAHALDLPIDIILVRTLRAPGSSGGTIGALAEDGDPHVDLAAVWQHGVSAADIELETARQQAALAGRRRRLRAGRPLELPANATIILADDGLTDGLGAMAAVRALRARHVSRVVLAVPASPPATVDRLNDMVDEIAVLETPLDLRAVGTFYEDFRFVPDAEIRELLAIRHPLRRGGAQPQQTR